VSLKRRLILPAFTAAVTLIVLLGVPRLSTSRALAIWIVLVAALVLLALVQHSREHDRHEHVPRFEQALRGRKPVATQAVELVQMERELVLGVADADHAQRRLLPLLRAAAAARLSARHGFALERRPDAARALLGEDVWELLRPDRPEPEDRHGPGVPLGRIAAVIERVEAL
jgi:ABC-type transport system involved in cytochrome bd biosynthesis fused ATPase/permease subunit